jgi:hypothetical protein
MFLCSNWVKDEKKKAIILSLIAVFNWKIPIPLYPRQKAYESYECILLDNSV